MIFMLTAAFAMPGADATWTVLSNGDPYIECTEADGQPWCRSTGTVPLPVDQVSLTLEDMPAHQDLFESIVRIDTVGPDTLHVVLNYPYPFSDRDYVARYTRTVEGEARIWRWEPAAVQPPADSAAVRLPRMAGEWRLVPDGARTRVTYTWQAEIAGSFPNALLPKARITAGTEALTDIRKASEKAAALVAGG